MTNDGAPVMRQSKPHTLHSSPFTPVLRPAEFWALEDLSFELKRGETLGLIGRNGSGKTTLLRVLNGILPPDQGEVKICGKVGGLIALGAGFHPHMSGRENIYLNGAILGMRTEEIKNKIQNIINFADIDGFIDSPVSTYSSGMHVRLGFAIAAVQEPDLLLLDEVLAVGDAPFRNKCYNKLGSMQRNAATIFVSHSMEQVARVCTRALLMDRGRIVFAGDVARAIERYYSLATEHDSEGEAFITVEDPVEVASVSLVETDIPYGANMCIEMDVESKRHLPGCSVRLVVYAASGVVAAEWDSLSLNKTICLSEGRNKIKFVLGPMNLRSGKYKMAIAMHDQGRIKHLVWSFKEKAFNVLGSFRGSCFYQLGGQYI